MRNPRTSRPPAADAGTGELRLKQVADLAFLIANKRCGLLHDPRVGKTAPECVYFWHLWANERERSVWTQPKSLMEKNRDELLKFSHFAESDVMIYNGEADLHDAKVLLMTFERWKRDWRRLLADLPDINCVGVDEWHMGYATVDSARYRELEAAMQRIERLAPMTGSLVKGRLKTAYPWIHLVEPRYYADAKQFNYFHEERDLDGTLLGYRNHWKVAEIFRCHAIRRTFEEEYGPRAEVIQTEIVDMAPKQRAAYDEFHAKACLELDDYILDGTMPAVAAIRARQICSHPETFGIGKGEVTGKDERLLVHAANWKERKDQFLVFAALQPEQRRIHALLQACGLKVGLINGDVSAKERDRIDRAFRAGDLDGIVASTACAGVGYNWVMADEVLLPSYDYDDVGIEQALMRGQGQREKPLKVTFLQYRKSVDWRILQIIEQKSIEANKVDPTRRVLRLHGFVEDKDGLINIPQSIY